MYEIVTIVKPILEEMGLYKGNDVSAKDLFDKYLVASPQGIKTFWKFQIIVKYEFNLFVKSIIFDVNSDEIYLLSCKFPENTVKPKELDYRESLMSSYIGRIYSIEDDENLIKYWLHVYEEYYDEFEDENNELYLYGRQHEEIARYWLLHGKHNLAANNPIVLRGQQIWDKFINGHICWNSKIDWIGTFKKKVDINHSTRRWLL